jgi:hypothetical protein
MRILMAILALQALLLAQAAQALTVSLTDDTRWVTSNTGPIGGFNETPTSFGADFYWDFPAAGTFQDSTVPKRNTFNSYSLSAAGGALGFSAGGTCNEYSCDVFSHTSGYNISFNTDVESILNISGAFEWLEGDVQYGRADLWLYEGGSLVMSHNYNADTALSLSVIDSYLLNAGQDYRLYMRASGGSGPFDGEWHESVVGFDFDATITATTTAVPVPAAAWLFGSALAGLGWMRRKKNRLTNLKTKFQKAHPCDGLFYA